jgi:hypothetical protein
LPDAEKREIDGGRKCEVERSAEYQAIGVRFPVEKIRPSFAG